LGDDNYIRCPLFRTTLLPRYYNNFILKGDTFGLNSDTLLTPILEGKLLPYNKIEMTTTIRALNECPLSIITVDE